jgi:hypothetical protein
MYVRELQISTMRLGAPRVRAGAGGEAAAGPRAGRRREAFPGADPLSRARPCGSACCSRAAPRRAVAALCCAGAAAAAAAAAGLARAAYSAAPAPAAFAAVHMCAVLQSRPRLPSA